MSNEQAIYLEPHLKLLAPVFMRDTIRAVAEVAEVREDKPIITLRTECYNQNGERVLDGQAVVFATRVS